MTGLRTSRPNLLSKTLTSSILPLIEKDSVSMEYVRDPAKGPWVSFDMGAEKDAKFVFDLLPQGYTDNYSMDLAIFPVAGYSAPHVDEGHAFFIVDGTAEMIIDGEICTASKGCVAAIPSGALHSIRNIGVTPLVMLTFYDPPRIRTAQKTGDGHQ
jgi:mannose-6-phosphate isomerase-like protein (cupin superfamily)